MPTNTADTSTTTTTRRRSTSETGHAKNLESLKKAREIAFVWGAKHQPTNPVYLIVNLDKLIDDAEKATGDLTTARAPYRAASSAADDAFEPLGKLMTRFERGFAASGAPTSAVEDLKTNTSKAKGRRKKPRAADNPDTPGIDEAERGHSASQMSRVNRIQHLDAAIATAKQYPQYAPNETDVTTQAFETLSAGLKAKTEAVDQPYAVVSDKLNHRDRVYYQNEDSVVNVGRGLKNYAISAFGFGSPEHKQMSKLEFKMVPR